MTNRDVNVSISVSLMSLLSTRYPLRQSAQEAGWVCSSCLHKISRKPIWRFSPLLAQTRNLQTDALRPSSIPFRKQLKDEAKQRRANGENVSRKRKGGSDGRQDKWEMTVGIEVHAQLNTERKLFSSQ